MKNQNKKDNFLKIIIKERKNLHQFDNQTIGDLFTSWEPYKMPYITIGPSRSLVCCSGDHKVQKKGRNKEKSTRLVDCKKNFWLLMMTFLALPAAFFTSCGPYKKVNTTNDLLGVFPIFQEFKKLDKTQPKSIEK